MEDDGSKSHDFSERFAMSSRVFTFILIHGLQVSIDACYTASYIIACVEWIHGSYGNWLYLWFCNEV